MREMQSYVVDNIEFILSIIIQYGTDGIKPGTYTSNSSYINWEFKE